MKDLGKWIVAGMVIVLVVLVLFGCFTVVDAGERGVVLRMGAINRTLSEGFGFKFPIIERVVKMNVRTQKYETKAPAYSRDIQPVDTIIALNFHVDLNAANILYLEVGKQYLATVIEPSIQESVKAITSGYTAQQLVEERHRVKESIKFQLSERLAKNHIIVDEFSIVNFEFSDEYETSIEAKQIAQQSALKAENDLKRIEFEAKQRIATATAEAEAIKIQASSISASGGAEYVRLKAVEKWDGKLPVYMLPDATMPFISINSTPNQ
jgi:regulator of protease activity HflC (stomatin/prohibitin superfamily)